jgi:hypothetical protein
VVLRISNTGWIYDEAPSKEEELKEGGRSVRRAPSAIALERFEAGRHGFIAAARDAQVGWCIRRDGGWYIEDMDCKSLAGPFRTLRAAASACQQVLAHEAGVTNPGW